MPCCSKEVSHICSRENIYNLDKLLVLFSSFNHLPAALPRYFTTRPSMPVELFREYASTNCVYAFGEVEQKQVDWARRYLPGRHQTVSQLSTCASYSGPATTKRGHQRIGPIYQVWLYIQGVRNSPCGTSDEPASSAFYAGWWISFEPTLVHIWNTGQCSVHLSTTSQILSFHTNLLSFPDEFTQRLDGRRQVELCHLQFSTMFYWVINLERFRIRGNILRGKNIPCERKLFLVIGESLMSLATFSKGHC